MNFAVANQLEDDLGNLSSKFTDIFKESSTLLEAMEDLELSVQIATDNNDTNELKKITTATFDLPSKQEILDNTVTPLKKSLDENCAKARLDKSESTDAINALVACEDAESVYNAYANSSKLFIQSQKNIEANLAKFGLNLVSPTPTPSPSPSPTPSPSPKLSVATKAPDPVKPTATPSIKTNIVKKITIKCVKGTVTKKVTALKPKCPAGYKKK
jgi:hypothetical protein